MSRLLVLVTNFFIYKLLIFFFLACYINFALLGTINMRRRADGSLRWLMWQSLILKDTRSFSLALVDINMIVIGPVLGG